VIVYVKIMIRFKRKVSLNMDTNCQLNLRQRLERLGAEEEGDRRQQGFFFVKHAI